MSNYPQTPLNTLRRLPERGAYDKETIRAIIDQASTCHVGFVQEGGPIVIPCLHGRIGDAIALHGANQSRLMQHVASGAVLCLAFTILDGLVLARSLFESSVNYRSVVAFGRGRLVASADEKLTCLKAISDHWVPGRWEDARQPTPKELNATAVVSVAIETASAKIHSGQPKDKEADYALPVWAGVVPVRQEYGAPVPDGRLIPGTALPAYLEGLLNG